jgi:hypothetical protein
MIGMDASVLPNLVIYVRNGSFTVPFGAYAFVIKTGWTTTSGTLPFCLDTAWVDQEASVSGINKKILEGLLIIGF